MEETREAGDAKQRNGGSILRFSLQKKKAILWKTENEFAGHISQVLFIYFIKHY